ncbi:cytochrome ubiquinol oxidase subunit I [Wolbachia endosymbiont of Ctenocephalides felis wCfeJ]|uniref:cytochrome ubiquinol oxidase subunit I n=1 Tax=Wolbachia endosymbiont of Ctenocephalides felis wCfeJ TaxID=2732594 RepID=UPI001447E06D|nr:cytochrome ubiquinol oxidase subunit I [Wolbachia endosymbiont of Ctenocephalides felis wCfeJ]WCR58469.1 MAG: Cytochrome bd-II ubiquinol oxidase subunit 1 [Wolbachia endosymbiont of Ctenocephalides felis wCfeJ]
MFEFDPLLLARVQFAFTISFHIIFPAFTIGLASFLAFLEWRWLRTDNTHFRDVYRFWVKIFAVAFGMGVVSGVVLSYQIGTNWSVFSDRVANVLGPLFCFEILTAFFLEASFLGIMLFGWNRVSPRMHFVSTCIVAVGTLISAFWILAANSWMQTPAGFSVGEDGLLYPTNWLEVIFNPSFPYRFVHMVTAAYLTTAFVVGGVGAFYLWKKRHVPQAKIMLSMATFMVALTAPFQLLVGDIHGLNTLKHQPAKIAAMEGIWKTEKGGGLRLFAYPDQQNEINHYEIKVPNLASLILTHDFLGEVKGLKEWKKEDRPPVVWVFWSFRAMVGIGFLMIMIGLISAIQYFRGRLFQSCFLHGWWMLMMPSGFIALLAGWFTTEIGRQPYTVYGILRTIESFSPAITGPQVAWSLIAFIVMYIHIFGASSYYILKLIYKGIPVIKEEEQFYKHGIGASVIEAGTSEKSSDHV